MKLTQRWAKRGWLLAIAYAISMARLHAQEAVNSNASADAIPSSIRDSQAKSQSRPTAPAGALLSYGPVNLHPHFSASYSYTRGIPVPNAKPVESEINSYSAGALIDLGKYAALDYMSNWSLYANDAVRDTYAQSFSLAGNRVVGDWGIQYSERYSKSAPILLETGRQTPQRSWNTSIGAGRAFGTMVSLQSSVNLSERYSDLSPDSREWSTMNWLVTPAAQRLGGGIGVGAGYNDVVGGTDTENQRFMGRLNWQPTEKLQLGTDAGMTITKSLGANAKTARAPLANATIGYNPTSTTTVSISHSRSLASAFIAEQLARSSSWSSSINQRILKRFYLRASYSVQSTSFIAVKALAVNTINPAGANAAAPNQFVISPPGRSDKATSWNLGLRTQLLQHFSIGVSYQLSKNDSSQTGFTSNTTQVGVDVSCQY